MIGVSEHRRNAEVLTLPEDGCACPSDTQGNLATLIGKFDGTAKYNSSCGLGLGLSDAMSCSRLAHPLPNIPFVSTWIVRKHALRGELVWMNWSKIYQKENIP